jgi:hypothetical protein
MVHSSVLAAAVVLTAVGGGEAHVKMLFTPLQMNIRNAASATGDGTFSVSGPCGGSSKLGANSFNVVQDGQQICAKINYNGGHANALNRFRATFACGAALGTGDQTVMSKLTALPLKNVAGTSTKIEADGTSVNSAVNTAAGYTMCVDLPTQNLAASVPDTDPKRQCTMSLLDQRQWGGCIDMKIAGAANAPAPAATAPPTPVKVQTFSAAAAGTYKVNSCDAESGGVCCLQGTLGVKDTGQVWGTLSVVPQSVFFKTAPKDGEAACPVFAASVNAMLKWDGDAAATFKAPSEVSSRNAAMAAPQPFELMARDPLKNGLVLTNINMDAPVILNAIAVRTGPLDVATTPPPAPAPVADPAGAVPPAGTGTGTVPAAGGNTAGSGTAGSNASGGFPVAIVGAAAGVLLVGAAVVAHRRNAGSGSAVAAAGHHSAKEMVGQYNPQYHQQQGYYQSGQTQMQQRM